jgi:hypothetical protein
MINEAGPRLKPGSAECPHPDDLDYGGVIGPVLVRDAIYADKRGRPMLVIGGRVMRSNWFNGDAGFVLEDAKPVPFLSAKGKLSSSKSQGENDVSVGDGKPRRVPPAGQRGAYVIGLSAFPRPVSTIAPPKLRSAPASSWLNS